MSVGESHDRRPVLILVIALVVAVTAYACGGHQARELAHTNRATPGALTTVAPTTTALPSTAAQTTVAPPLTTIPVPPTAPAPTAAPATAAPPAPVGGPGVAVGDSVLEDVRLYAPATLMSHGFSINAAVSRQWGVGVAILSHLRAVGQLPPVVIVALGSNGRIDAGQFDQMMQACAGAKRVVFMTVTGPLGGNNPIITAGVGRYRSTATLADWAGLAAGHPDWFGGDHVHIGPAGAAALGNLLASVA